MYRGLVVTLRPVILHSRTDYGGCSASYLAIPWNNDASDSDLNPTANQRMLNLTLGPTWDQMMMKATLLRQRPRANLQCSNTLQSNRPVIQNASSTRGSARREDILRRSYVKVAKKQEQLLRLLFELGLAWTAQFFRALRLWL